MARSSFDETEICEATSVTNAPTAYPFTISVWCKLDDAGGSGTCGGFSDASNASFNGAIIQVIKNTVPNPDEFNVRININNFFVLGSIDLNDSAWHHLCFVGRSTTDREQYVDGISDGTDATNATFPTDIDNYSIGSFRANGVFGEEALHSYAELAIWDEDLSVAHIKALAAGSPPTIVKPGISLLCYLPTWGTTSPEPDLSQYSQNGVITGTTTKVDHPPVGRQVKPPSLHAERRVRSTDDALILDRIVPV